MILVSPIPLSPFGVVIFGIGGLRSPRLSPFYLPVNK